MATDEAFVTPVVVLRPAAEGLEASRPRAALVVRFPGAHEIREALTQGLLGRGW